MVHKKYTYKNGKRFGPYYYENKRVNGRIVTRYLGPAPKRNHALNWVYSSFGLLLVLSVFLLFQNVGELAFFSPQFNHLTIDLENAVVGELISGTSFVRLRAGELLPQGSGVLVRSGDSENVRDLIDLVDLETTSGEFYITGSSLSGSGQGYGLIGSREVYPDVSFELEIVTNVDDELDVVAPSGGGSGAGEGVVDGGSVPPTRPQDGGSGDNEDVVKESESNADEGSEDVGPPARPQDSGKVSGDSSSGESDSRSDSSGGEDASSSSDDGGSDSSGSSSSSGDSGSSSGGSSGGESSGGDSGGSSSSGGESGGSNGDSSDGGSGGGDSGGGDGGSSSSSGGGDSGSSSGSSSDSGGGDSGGGEVSLSPEVSIVSGSVNAQENLVYSLDEGQNVKVVLGSVMVNGEVVDEGLIEVVVNGEAVVSTEYFEVEEGFGEEFLGDEVLEFDFDLDEFGFVAEEGEFVVELVYENETLDEDSEILLPLASNESSFLNDSILDIILNESERNETVVSGNETNSTEDVSFAYSGAVLGRDLVVTEVKEIVVSGEARVAVPESAEVISVAKVPKEQGERKEDEKRESDFFVEEKDAIEIEEDILLAPEAAPGNKDVVVDVAAEEGVFDLEVTLRLPGPRLVRDELIADGKVVEITTAEGVHYDNALLFTQWDISWGEPSLAAVRIERESDGLIIFPESVEDFDEDGVVDVVWRSDLSNQTFLIIIEITKAEHLDANQTFIADIYEEVREQDGVWSDEISDGEFVRVTFERNLTSVNDITVYPRVTSGIPRIEIYEIDGNETVAEFESLMDDELNTVYLSGLVGFQDTFDLLILDGAVEFDWIVDPAGIVLLSDGSCGDNCEFCYDEEPSGHNTIDSCADKNVCLFDKANCQTAWIDDVFIDDLNRSDQFLIEDEINVTCQVKCYGSIAGDPINVSISYHNGSSWELVYSDTCPDITYPGTPTNICSDDFRNFSTTVVLDSVVANHSARCTASWRPNDLICGSFNSIHDSDDVSLVVRPPVPLVTIDSPEPGELYVSDDLPLEFNVTLDITGSVLYSLDNWQTNVTMSSDDGLKFNASVSSLSDGNKVLRFYANTSFGGINGTENVSFQFENRFIDDCGHSIDVDGLVYVLTTNLSCSSGFTIGASDIVFDGQGHFIYGDGNGQGILDFINSKHNVTIRNVTINGFGYGIRLDVAENYSIEHVSLVNNSFAGAILLGNQNSRINFSDTFISSNLGPGVDLRTSENYFARVVFHNNTNGVKIDDGSDNVFVDSLINGSRDVALLLTGSSSDSNLFSNLRITETNSSFDDVRFGISGIDGTVFENVSFIEDYSFVGLGGSIIVRDPAFGEIKFLEAVNGSGTNFTNDVRIGNNLAVVEIGNNLGLNRSANITLYGTPGSGLAEPELLRDGTGCGDVCFNLSSLTESIVVFNVSGWSNYSVGDVTFPGVTIHFPVEGGNYSASDLPLNFNVSLNENGSVLYSLDGGVNNFTMFDGVHVVGQYFNATNGSIADGSYVFSVYANDSAGNLNYTENVSFRMDRVDPTGEYVFPTKLNGFISGNDSVGINVSAFDAASGVEQIRLTVSQGRSSQSQTGFGDSFYWVFSNLADGNYSYGAVITDFSGNSLQLTSRNISIDTTPPNISYITPPTPQERAVIGTSNFSVNVSVEDDHSMYGFTNLDDSLIAWLRMDNESVVGENDTHVYDWSGNGNNGTVGGDTFPNSSGRFGGSFGFDGNDGSLETEDGLVTSGQEQLTVSVWVRSFDASSVNLGVLGHRGPNHHFSIRRFSGKYQFRVDNNSSGFAQAESDSQYFDSDWHHLVGTYNKTNVLLYVDGVVQSSQPVLQGPMEASHPLDTLVVGEEQITSGNYWNGSLDEVLIFDRGFSAEEVGSLFASGVSQFSSSYLASDGDYTIQSYVVDIVGNMNSTEERFFEVITNLPPDDPVVFINSTDGGNRTLQDLHCIANVTDPDGNDIDVNVTWYNGSELHSSFVYLDQPEGEFFDAVLDSGNTSKNEIWKCGMELSDDELFSEMVNSSELTILNTPPEIVSLSSPVDVPTLIQDRTPTLSWVAQDDDNDAVSFSVNVSFVPDSGSSCSDGVIPVFPLSFLTTTTSSSYTFSNDLNCFYVVSGFEDRYNWSVRANDSESFGDWFSPGGSFGIEMLVSLNVTRNVIDFGSLNNGENEATDDDSPLPFLIENDGNVDLDVSLQAGLSDPDLWESDPTPTAAYLYKADVFEAGSYVSATTTYENVSLTSEEFISGLRYVDVSDSAEVDLNISVPVDEGPGTKSAVITFIGAFGE